LSIPPKKDKNELRMISINEEKNLIKSWSHQTRIEGFQDK
jgi:hypothetical protein